MEGQRQVRYQGRREIAGGRWHNGFTRNKGAVGDGGLPLAPRRVLIAWAAHGLLGLPTGTSRATPLRVVAGSHHVTAARTPDAGTCSHFDAMPFIHLSKDWPQRRSPLLSYLLFCSLRDDCASSWPCPLGLGLAPASSLDAPNQPYLVSSQLACLAGRPRSCSTISLQPSAAPSAAFQ